MCTLEDSTTEILSIIERIAVNFCCLSVCVLNESMLVGDSTIDICSIFRDTTILDVVYIIMVYERVDIISLRRSRLYVVQSV
jgi:hypothetical protein